MLRQEPTAVQAVTPPHEAARLHALQDLDVLDTAAEQIFDDVARLAALICGTPIALISLVDGDRQWFKARVGLEAQETPRDVAFCAHAILEPDEVMVVSDASIDSRFTANPLVTGDPRIRFYAGAPIVTDAGHALGTVCAIDRQPRELTAEQLDALRALSRQTAQMLQWRRALRERERSLMAELERGRERLALAAALSAQALDLQSFIDRDLVFRYVNDRHLAYWGAQREHFEGRSVHDVMGTTEVAPIIMPALARALAGERADFEAAFDFPALGRRHMEVTCVPVRDAGQVIGVVVRAHDVHALRTAQDRLAAAHDVLAQRNAIQQQFIHMVSHDLREPINSICNFADELTTHHGTQLDAAGRRYLGFVLQGGLRMRTLLDDLLDYVRLDGHAMEFDRVDLDAVVDDLLVDLATAISDCGAQIERQPLGTVWGDRSQVRLMLQNLLSNALKFRAAGRSPQVRISAQVDAGMRRVEIADDGIGIAPEHQGQIFGIFKRLNSRRAYEGTGLGLATAKRIAELHGGRLALRSALGAGSVFSVALPIDRQAPSPSEAP